MSKLGSVLIIISGIILMAIRALGIRDDARVLPYDLTFLFFGMGFILPGIFLKLKTDTSSELRIVNNVL
jgi:hypothetical protein